MPLVFNPFTGTFDYVNAPAPGAIQEIRYQINTTATQDSATQIPANAVVVEATIDVITPFSNGTQISIGHAI